MIEKQLVRFAAALLTIAALVLAPRAARAAKDNSSSSCDNLVQNGNDDCCMWTPPITSTPVTVDGANTGSEWTGVAFKTPSGTLTGAHQIQVRHVRSVTSDSLSFFITILDASFSPDDSVELHFDPLHDDGPPTANTGDDVRFKIFRGTDPGHAPRRITAGGDVAWTPSGGAGAFAVSNAPDRWTVEIRLDAPELGVSYLNALVGFAILLNDFDSGNIASWPKNFAPATPFTTGAALKNRLPIDYVLSLDYSGSMTAFDGLPEHRWKRAVRAADMFVAVAGLFRQPDYFDDRVGGSRYAWDCGNETGGDTTAQFPPGTDVGSGVLGSFPSAGTNRFFPHVSPDPPGSNCTPIQRGLQFALSQFNTTSAAPEREKIVVLLSDGFHNMPSAASGFNSTPASAFTPGQRSSHKVRTVSMGPDATAGTALLAGIAAAFNSTGLEAKYNQLSAANNLLDAYLETLQQPLHVNRVNDDSPASSDGSYQLGTVDRVVFLGAWDTPGNAKQLRVERDGVVIAGTSIGPDTAVGYSAMVIDHPTSGGTWKLAGPAGERPNHRFVVVDLRVYAEFFAEPKLYDTGAPILLQVRLRDQGKPVLNADATVEVAIPGQGLGSFLATTGDGCRKSEPRFPQIGNKGDPRFASGGPLSPAPAATAPPGTPDPPPGRYALAAQLLQQCGQKDEKNDLPGTRLFDDGTHGDLVAGDGVYTLSFGTTLEGSYNFRFHVRGKDSSGVAFGRTSLMSQYVRVAPTAEATATSFQLGPVSDGKQTAFVFFLPKDRLGNYLGPGFADGYHVKVVGGSLVGAVVDLGRGIYGQELHFPPQGPLPQVLIEGDDPPFKQVVNVGTLSPGGRGWRWLLLLLLLVLLLIAIIMLVRRRHAHP